MEYQVEEGPKGPKARDLQFQVRPAWPRDTRGGFLPSGAPAARPLSVQAERQQPNYELKCGKSAGSGISCGGNVFSHHS